MQKTLKLLNLSLSITNMFAYSRKFPENFEEVLEKTRKKLAEEGFGILCEIDVKETLKKKIGVDFEDYIILGACSPKHAHGVLSREKDFGLLLPCNVVVYRDGDEVVVSTVLPTELTKMSSDEEIMKIAEEIEEKLKRVVDSV